MIAFGLVNQPLPQCLGIFFRQIRQGGLLDPSQFHQPCYGGKQVVKVVDMFAPFVISDMPPPFVSFSGRRIILFLGTDLNSAP